MRGEPSNPSVNRYLVDKSMDHIDHALGRPVDPMGATYRNRFVAGGADADELSMSPHWEEGRRCGEMRYFGVTQAGRQALANHLKAIGDKTRAFEVMFDGRTTRVPAITAAKARYALWLDISDCFSDLTFADFCRRTIVRAPHRERPEAPT